MLAKYRDNSSDYFKTYTKYVFKIISFIKKSDEITAILLPVMNIDWTPITKDSSDVYKATVYRNRLITIGINDLQIILDDEIPQQIKRDLKISNILEQSLIS